jgi:hypothetical protein
MQYRAARSVVTRLVATTVWPVRLRPGRARELSGMAVVSIWLLDSSADIGKNSGRERLLHEEGQSQDNAYLARYGC